MGTFRVTQRLLTDRVLNNINYQSRRILRLQDQLATGRSVNSPSDAPLAARRAIDANSEVAANDQYLTNIISAQPFLLETETAVLTVNDALLRSRELVLQASNSTNGQEQLDQIAIEINEIIESVLAEANGTSNDRYLFGGTRSGQPPFEATRNADGEVTAVNYIGNDEHFQVEISDGIRVNGNETGADVFEQTLPGTVDTFQMLIDIRDNMRAGGGNPLTTRLEELGQAQDQLLISIARLGSIQRRLEQVDSNLRDINVQLEEVVSDNIDADFAEVIVELNTQSNAFQASLNAGSRVIQPSLLQFLG